MLLWLWLACSAGGGGADSGPAADDTAADTASGDTSSDDSSPDDSSPDDSDGDTGDGMLPAFKYLYSALRDSCGDCHTSEYVGAFLVEGDLAETHDRLLNRAPITLPSARYVIPGDAANSLLLQKLAELPPVGEQMPPEASEGPPLDSSIADALWQWVDGGAPL